MIRIYEKDVFSFVTKAARKKKKSEYFKMW